MASIQLIIDNPGKGELTYAGTQVSAADPGSAQWKTNAGDTRIDIHATTLSGMSMASVLSQFENGAFVYVRTSGEDRIYSVQGMTDHTSWFELDVTLESSSTGFALNSGDVHSVEFVLPKGVGGAGVTDHGALTGLGDDDHTQYLNLGRHDAVSGNPHGVTNAQVGLGSADNTSDLDKPISNATQSALDNKLSETTHDALPSDNPHGVTQAQVGLGNVDNTSDADKPVSTAQQTALDGKLDTSHAGGAEHIDWSVTGAEQVHADRYTSGGGTWGSITGTLSAQTDLQGELDGKSDTGHGHATLPTADQKDALVGGDPGSNPPNAGNPYVTLAEVGALGGGTVTSVSVSATDGLEVDSGSPITTAGTIVIGSDKLLGIEAGAVAAGATGDAFAGSHPAAGHTNTPTAQQKAALAGTTGTPDTGNEYVTDSDTRMSDARTPTLHAYDTHTGAVPAADLPAATTTVQGAVELATDGESAANLCVQANDARLSDARAPTAHNHTESEISDLGAYPDATGQPATKLAQTDGADGWTFVDTPAGGTEVNDLTASVTWANIPDANVPESSVTQHEAALSITESQISDLDHVDSVARSVANAAKTKTDWLIVGQEVNLDTLESDVADNTDHGALTDNPHSTSIANIVSGSLDQLNDLVVNATLDDAEDPRTADAIKTSGADVAIDNTPPAADYILKTSSATQASWVPDTGGTENNDLTAAVTWANVPDANITESSVTQHTAAVVTTAAVTTAGALMDSEILDADIKTLSLPAFTTISAFSATLVEDDNDAAARSTLGVDAAGTDNSTNVTLANPASYLSLAGQVLTHDPIDLASEVEGELPIAGIAQFTVTDLNDRLIGATFGGTAVGSFPQLVSTAGGPGFPAGIDGSLLEDVPAVPASQSDAGAAIFDSAGDFGFLTGVGKTSLPMLAKGTGVAPAFEKLPVGSIAPTGGAAGKVAGWIDASTVGWVDSGGPQKICDSKQFTFTPANSNWHFLYYTDTGAGTIGHDLGSNVAATAVAAIGALDMGMMVPSAGVLASITLGGTTTAAATYAVRPIVIYAGTASDMSGGIDSTNGYVAFAFENHPVYVDPGVDDVSAYDRVGFMIRRVAGTGSIYLNSTITLSLQ